MVKRCLAELKERYPIDYAVVLAYFPGKKQDAGEESPADTVLPEGIETVPPKFAINYRNRWMIDHSDYVVSYVSHTFGGAFKFMSMAQNRKKQVINLAAMTGKEPPL